MDEIAQGTRREDWIPVGDHRLDPYDHTLWSEAGPIQLSPLASRFLQVLARQPGAVVDRAALVDELWNGDWLVGDPGLHRVVSELRRAVGDSPRRPRLVQTVHRRGYRLVGSRPALAAPPAPDGRGEVPATGQRLLTKRQWQLLIVGALLFLLVAGGLKVVLDLLIEAMAIERIGETSHSFGNLAAD